MSAAREPRRTARTTPPPALECPAPMANYHCRDCGTWLLASDATHGRLRTRCPNRRCGRVQMVFLGGFRPKDAGAAEAGT